MWPLRKIDLLMLRSFLGPFAVSFGIAVFILIMQFMWLYIDDIAGKGVSIFILMELIGYLSISIFPMALPIGVLIASVMLLGNLAERYELSSIKSAGVSLLRILRPLMVVCFGIALFSYVCSDYIIPVANLKFKSRLFDIRKQKPALSIEKGIFNDDFRQFVIRVGEKQSDGETIEDVLIEDQSNTGRTRFNQILADSGQMYTSADKRFFVMNLFHGTQYQDPGTMSNSSNQKQKFPFVRTKFESWTKVWDMREFDMNRTDEDRFKAQRTMLTMSQLRITVDSLHKSMWQGHQDIATDMLMNVKRPLVKPQLANAPKPVENKRPEPIISSNIDPITGIAASGTSQNPISTQQKKQKKNTPPPVINTQNLPKAGISSSKSQAQEQPKTSTQPQPVASNGASQVAQKGIATPAPSPNITQTQAPATPTAVPVQHSKNPNIPRQQLNKPIEQYSSLAMTFDSTKRNALIDDAVRQVRLVQTNLETRRVAISQLSMEAVKNSYELYVKYSFALVCFIFLFVGGPMGAIIRKGGFGYPILISIVFFVTFIFLTILCRKLAEAYVLAPLYAALTPCIILAVIGGILTHRANHDAQLFSTERIERVWAWVVNKWNKRRFKAI
jgi:lipopolysaccharide export system permease protein